MGENEFYNFQDPNLRKIHLIKFELYRLLWSIESSIYHMRYNVVRLYVTKKGTQEDLMDEVERTLINIQDLLNECKNYCKRGKENETINSN